MLPVLLVTAFADIRDAVVAMRDGALNYLSKPIDLDELLVSVQQATGLAQSGPLKFSDIVRHEILLTEPIEGIADGPDVAGSIIDDADHSDPFVDGSEPEDLGSIAIACFSALATLLKIASIL